MDGHVSGGLAATLKDKSLLKDKCYIDGAWVGGAATIAVTNPVDESVIGHVPKLGAAETRRAIEAARRAQKLWAQQDRQGARRNPAQMVRPDDGEPGRSRAHHDRRAGQAACGVARRDRLWRLVHRVLRRGGQAHLRRDDPLALVDLAHGRHQAAARRGRGDHAVELPQRDDHAQGRPGARRRLRLRLQAGGRDAAVGARSGRTRRTRRHSRRRLLGDRPARRARSARR